MFERSTLSAVYALSQDGRAGQAAEKSIFDFSDAVDELLLAELSLKARFSRLFVRALHIKRGFRAFAGRTRGSDATDVAIVVVIVIFYKFSTTSLGRGLRSIHPRT
ncbi:hypothetical protein [Paenibacillus alginolyticus]|uniref:hypothetical protein n=1 Tax=Paenibacillus alginolyticus TaxID=59839 RepID=UPI0003F6AA4F|nr:hypothetical protein [Paenibacillus alginolyticus]